MAGLFICPHCGAATQVAPEFAGRSGPCAHCGRFVSIPADLGEHETSAGKRLPRARGDSSVRVLFIIGALLAVLVVGLVIGGRILAGMLAAKMDQERCSEQLRRIGVALESYYDDYSAYPPVVTRGAKGESLHSWRVLLLPYLGKAEEALYKEYRFEEPWNGPHNRELADLMPAAYGCPCDPAAFEFSQTSYLALVEGSTGDFATPPEIAEVNQPRKTKGKAKVPPKTRYLIIEVAESGVNWLKPQDFTFGAADGTLPGGPRAQFSYHVGGVNALERDGSTSLMSEKQAKVAFLAPGQ
jgi:hypothetical protein